MTAKIDWDPIRRLAQQVLEQRAPLELTDEVRSLLRRSAEEVAIPAEEAEKALGTLRTARALLRKISRRIQVGSDRIGKARSQAYRLRDAGKLKAARQHMEKVLAVEVVPLYREHAENVLSNIGRFQAVADTGQADPELPERAQLPFLLRRIRDGRPLELTNGMRAFLRRAAAAVALRAGEVEEASVTPETASALLGKILARFDEGSERLRTAQNGSGTDGGTAGRGGSRRGTSADARCADGGDCPPVPADGRRAFGWLEWTIYSGRQAERRVGEMMRYA
jgi:DUSAM domain-containing protein